MAPNGKRPIAVEVETLPGGKAVVLLPDNFEGDVWLHCTGGIVHKYTQKQTGRPKQIMGEVELTETSP